MDDKTAKKVEHRYSNKEHKYKAQVDFLVNMVKYRSDIGDPFFQGRSHFCPESLISLLQKVVQTIIKKLYMKLRANF